MIIAKQKKEENIAEYILYMWQLEDLIRAYRFDMNQIHADIIQKYQVDEKTKKEIKNWYEGLIDMMHIENITEKGHLNMVKHILGDLEQFHRKLLLLEDQANYRDLYYKTKGFIQEFKDQAITENLSELEVCFTGLYGLMVLRMKKQRIQPETLEALSSFSALLAALSKKYKDYEDGIIEI